MSDKTGRPADTRSVVDAVHFTPTPFPAGATVGTSMVVDGVEWARGADGNWHSSIRGLVAAEEGTAEDFAAALDDMARLTRELEEARAENARLREAMRRAVADYIGSEGCSCCQDDEHEAHERALAILLGVPRHADDSGWDWWPEPTQGGRDDHA